MKKENIIILGFTVIVVIPLTLMCYGLFVEVRKNIQCDELPPKRQDILVCEEKGGIPIISGWNGSLKNCIFN